MLKIYYSDVKKLKKRKIFVHFDSARKQDESRQCNPCFLLGDTFFNAIWDLWEWCSGRKETSLLLWHSTVWSLPGVIKICKSLHFLFFCKFLLLFFCKLFKKIFWLFICNKQKTGVTLMRLTLFSCRVEMDKDLSFFNSLTSE